MQQKTKLRSCYGFHKNSKNIYLFVCFPVALFSVLHVFDSFFYCLFIKYMHFYRFCQSLFSSSSNHAAVWLSHLVKILSQELPNVGLWAQHWWRVIHVRLLGLSGGSTLASFRHSRGICIIEPYPCQYLSLRVPRIPGQDEHLYRMPWCTLGFSLRDSPFIPSAARNEGCQWLTVHPSPGSALYWRKLPLPRSHFSMGQPIPMTGLATLLQ